MRTRRISLGLAQIEDFAVATDLSEDRLKAIEAGGQRIFAKNLMLIAEKLQIDWNKLVDWEAVEVIEASRRAAKAVVERRQTQPAKSSIEVEGGRSWLDRD